MKKKGRVVVSYGQSVCLYCKRPFERLRPWAKFCSPYCRTAYWNATNRRVTTPGMITEVDGKKLDRPVPVIDERLQRRVEAEVAGAYIRRK